MGVIKCPGAVNHPWIHRGVVKCCWYCGRCPQEHGFKLLAGDICPDCKRKAEILLKPLGA